MAAIYGGTVGGDEGRVMVGRDRELARVTGLLGDVLAGRGCLVLCTGEAGIGKTRLAEELAAVATARDVPVAWARAADEGSLPPYGLWRLVFGERAFGAGIGLLSQVFDDARRAGLGADSGSAQRFALFAAVRRRLVLAAEPGGLLLVLDDLQWADEASVVLLADLVRQLRGTRMLVFASYRALPGPGDETLLRLSAEANAERVDLHGLSAGAVADLLRATGLPASDEQVDEVRSERTVTRSWSGSWPGCSPSGAGAGPVRCRDGWLARRPTGLFRCRSPPGRCCTPPRWPATASRLACWPGCWACPC